MGRLKKLIGVQGFAWRLTSLLVILCLAVVAVMAIVTSTAYAASGTVHSAALSPSYRHPVTNKIEDSGGSASYATGQAMVESAVAKTGQLEVLDSGAIYLTMRMSLIDQVESFEFHAQKRGASGWSKTKGEVSQRGTDSNGTTNDVRVKVPARNAIVRVKMFVTAMGREVVFFVGIGKLSTGAPKGFKALMVTGASSGGSSSSSSSQGSGSSSSNSQSSSSSKNGESSSTSSSSKASKKESASEANGDDSDSSSNGGSDSDASEEEDAEKSDAETLNEEQTATAQGLSLSTTPSDEEAQANQQAAQAQEDGSASEGGAALTVSAVNLVELVVLIAVAIMAIGLVLIAVIAVVVWHFRKNWNRWGATDPDDYSSAYWRQHHEG